MRLSKRSLISLATIAWLLATLVGPAWASDCRGKCCRAKAAAKEAHRPVVSSPACCCCDGHGRSNCHLETSLQGAEEFLGLTSSSHHRTLGSIAPAASRAPETGPQGHYPDRAPPDRLGLSTTSLGISTVLIC